MKSKKVAYPYLIWMFMFTLIPIIMISYYAFTDSSGAISLESFSNVLYYKDVFLNSLWIAFLATIICIALAYPLAYIVSKASARAQKISIMLLMLPMWMNFLLRIYSWVLLLQNNGPIDRVLNVFGLDFVLIGNKGAVVLGMVYEFLPFMVLPIYTVLSKIDNSLIEAAQDLGANNISVFKKIILPLSVPGIVSGVTMVFVPAASTFLVSQYLGGTNDIMIGDIIEKVFYSDYNTGAALSFVLMVAILIFIIVMNKFGDEEAIGI